MKKTQARAARALRGLALLVLGGGYLAGCSHHGGGSLRALAAADGKLTDGALTTSEKVSTAPKEAGKITLYKNNEPQSGNPSSVAAALKAIPTTGSDVWTIELEPGTYDETEQLKYNGSATIKISGKSKTPYGLDVLIKGVGVKEKYNDESSRSMFEIFGTGDTILEYVMMEHKDMMSDFWYTGDDKKEHNATQREVIGHQSKGTLAAYNCSFISRQDTIRTESKAWFYKCYIEGDVDFLWIEMAGTKESKVALYEECILRAMSDRKDTVYFTAPRLPVKNEVWKGLVIWNSRLEAKENLKKVYLGRNPWNEQKDKEDGTSYFKTFYENVAIVNTKLYGKALEEAIWASGAHGTDDQRFVGFKTDSHFRKSSSGLGAIIGPDIVSAEYAGRNNILNRYYDIAAGVFKEDATAYWDVAAVIADNHWDAAEDTSGSLGEGEAKVNSKTYDIAALALAASNMEPKDSNEGKALTDGSSSDGVLTWKNLKAAKVAYGTVTQSTTEITLKVSEPSVISWAGSTYANGTISVEDANGKSLVTAADARAASEGGSQTFLYTETGETTLTLTFTGSTYINNIIIKTLTDEKNKASAIAVKLGATQIAKAEATTATATVTPYYLNNTGSDVISTDVTWTSSNPSVATVNASSGAVTGVAAGTADIIATSKATPSVTGKATLTVTETPTTVVPLVTWNFGTSNVTVLDSDKNTKDNKTLEGVAGYLQGDSTNVLIEVAATGKIAARDKDAQINKDTILKIPVSNGSVVTITNYGDSDYRLTYTLNGVEVGADPQVATWKATSAGYVELKATNSQYLVSISVTNVDTADNHTTQANGSISN